MIAACAWTLSKSQVPPADFTFVNATEVKGLDPAKVIGQPEGRLLYALFEGLVRLHPKTLEPLPGVAQRWEISDDQLRYTFYLRDSARWSDGTLITSADFAYSLRRLLDPRTSAEYAYQAWYLENAKRYTAGGRAVGPGDRVEVELNRRVGDIDALRGELVHGVLVRIERKDGTEISAAEREVEMRQENFSLEQWTFVVETAAGVRRFRYASDETAQRKERGANGNDEEGEPPEGSRLALRGKGPLPCRQVLLDFSEVGVRCLDERTLELRLAHPAKYFLGLLGFYPLFPVQQACVERYGTPHWTYVKNIVCNGAYVLQFRRHRDRTRLIKNPFYWNRNEAKLETIDVLAAPSSQTGLNLYLTGEADWITDVPPAALRELLQAEPSRDDLNPSTFLNTYFYLLNTNRPPLEDVRVRQALSLALDRREITERILAAGEEPARSLVPPGLTGYDASQCDANDAERARALLAEAGFPEGRGFPTLTILSNTHETHRAIGELVRKQWQRNLGIQVKGRQEEWGAYLSSQRQSEYDLCRRGWIGDYADPNTFLDLFTRESEQNSTGWSDPEYDRLIAAAARELDGKRRMELFHQAEQILMQQLPLLPIYFYKSKNMVKPYVRGFYNNLLDYHPLWELSIDRSQSTPNPFLGER